MSLSQFIRYSMVVIILAVVAFAAYQAYLILGPKDWSSSRPDGPSVHVINNSDVDICDVWIQRDFGASTGEIVTYDRRIKSGNDLYFKVEPGTYILTVYDCDDNLIDQTRDAYIETTYDWEIQ
jgi:hypothetical protein